MGAKQRRGKNDKTASETSSSALEDQVQKAQATVQRGLEATAILHSQWRLHLLRLSYLVVLITLHQWQGPMTYCLYDIKSYNKSLTPLDNESWRVSGYRAIYYVINDTLCEFLSFVMAGLVTLFLNKMSNQPVISLVTINGTTRPQESFVTNMYYMISTGLVPPILNFYFTRSKAKATKSCLNHSSVVLSGGGWTRSALEDETMAAAVRGFPVVIIFHTVATACCWFMEMQRGQQNTNMQMLEKFQRDLAQAKKGQEIKKKS